MTTTLTAITTRSGGWWAVRVPEVRGLNTQARRLDQIEAMVRDAVRLFDDEVDDVTDVEVVIELASVEDSVTEAVEAREAAEWAALTALANTRRAAADLVAKGFTVRDAAYLLGITPSRVSQLTKAS